MTGSDDAVRTDKWGGRLDDYPPESDYGTLLGFNVTGNAVYADTDRAALAVLGPDGSLRHPPRDRWFAATFPLAEVGLSPADYVFYAADEVGPWRALTEFAREAVRGRGVDPERVLADGPAVADVAPLVDRLRESDDTAERSAAASELRRLVVVDPGAVVPHLSVILDVLSTRRAETDDRQPPEEGDEQYERLAGLTDLSFVVARCARSAPEPVAERVDQLLPVLGRDRETSDVAGFLEYQLDTLDVLGRRVPERVERVLLDEFDAGSDHAVAALNALYRLEHRYATSDHPLFGRPAVRESVADLTDAPDERVREAATDVETIHGFHRDT